MKSNRKESVLNLRANSVIYRKLTLLYLVDFKLGGADANIRNIEKLTARFSR